MIASTVDRKRNIYTKVTQIETTSLNSDKINKVYNLVFKEGSIICSDGNFGYGFLALNYHLELHNYTSRNKEKRGIYHILIMAIVFINN